ncbi:ATP-binding cassette domain-containing protein [Mogibacterium timidum]|uniref:ABC transporter ATP-binding protein/permease n=1 Tax=Mogibacterium timidum TaxID=35519 RepID=UPI0028E2D2D7|nr:ATP-binding cassette domain-containing protein [Mogibacterium timidum]
MSHMIELNRVSKYYTNRDTVSTGLSKVSLNLDMGEFVAITGESGSGKSTLLNVISGLDTYEEGEMFVGGQDTSAFKTVDYERYRKTYIGNIFQDFNLVNSYTVYQNIELSMLMCGMKRSECRDRVNELIDLVDLGEYRRTKASRLSGGQKQRVAIARALAKDAPIIVADEPTGNLDSASAAKVMETLHRISKDKLVVIVTHNYEQAEPFVTRKITVHDGKIMEDKEIRAHQSIDESELMLPGIVFDEEDEQLADSGRTVNESPSEAEAGTAAGDTATASIAAEYADVADRIAHEEAEEGQAAAAPARMSRVARNAGREPAKPIFDISKRADNGKSEHADKRTERRKRTAATVTRRDDMGVGNELRLGARNTFNLPAKFILLFFIYIFVATSVLSLYASNKSSLHNMEISGLNNQFFTNTSPERIIVKKADNSAFTDEDYVRLSRMKHVKSIVKEDPVVDSIFSINADFYAAGSLHPDHKIKQSDLTYGTLPKADNDIVLVTDKTTQSYQDIVANKDAIIGKEFDFGDDATGATLPAGKVRITGIIIYSDGEGSRINPMSGTVKYYCSDAFARKVVINSLSNKSKAVIDYNGQKVKQTNAGAFVEPNANVPKGEAYIFEDQNKNYKDEKWQNQPLGISISNIYFSSSVSLKTTKSVTKSNATKLLGISKDDYENKIAKVYINPEDSAELFNKGTYQVSVFADNDLNIDELVTAINKTGLYKQFAMKKMVDKKNPTPQMFLSRTMAIIFTAVALVVLFFIAYMIIRLIMRSRNSYYATLRILGGTRKNTSAILRIELLIMMVIALAIDFTGILLMKAGLVNIKVLKSAMMFLDFKDYIILTAALLLMSLLIANRYSRKIFGRSAMNVYREEE